MRRVEDVMAAWMAWRQRKRGATFCTKIAVFS
jgi:hypothetical protein